MNYISDILYWISTGLLVPVIVLLIILFCRAILLAGSFYGQYLSIRKTEAMLRNELGRLTPDCVEDLSSKLPEKSRSLVIMYMRQILDARDTPAQIQRLLANFEIAADKDLAISKTLTKLGPILGLMGTLIPMGPGPCRTGKRRHSFHGLQYADSFCNNCCRTGGGGGRFPHTTSQTTLVLAGYDQPRIYLRIAE